MGCFREIYYLEFNIELLRETFEMFSKERKSADLDDRNITFQAQSTVIITSGKCREKKNKKRKK